jgi:hypothetical protein
MFNIFKRKAPTEADFDILHDVTSIRVRMTKAEIEKLFLYWTQDESTKAMSDMRLGRLIEENCANFRETYGDELLADQTTNASIMAKDLIAAFVKLKLIKAVPAKMISAYKISKRGEQIRQFYVIKHGLRGTLYDRMDRFTAA